VSVAAIKAVQFEGVEGWHFLFGVTCLVCGHRTMFRHERLTPGELQGSVSMGSLIVSMDIREAVDTFQKVLRTDATFPLLEACSR
jgi:hypothetical protein